MLTRPKTIVLMVFATMCVGGDGINVATSGSESGKTEYIYFTSKQSWNTARHVCHGMGGYLARLDSPQRLARVKDNHDSGLWDQNWDHAWIGLHRNAFGVLWDSQQCSPFNVSYSTMGVFSDQSDYTDASGDACFRHKIDVYLLESQQCSTLHTFICERTADACPYTNTGMSVVIAANSNATAASCQMACDQLLGCNTVANHYDTLCIFFTAPASVDNVVYYKACHSDDSLNETNVDDYSVTQMDDPIKCVESLESTNPQSSVNIVVLGSTDAMCPSSVPRPAVPTPPAQPCPSQLVTVSGNDRYISVTETATSIVYQLTTVTKTEVVSSCKQYPTPSVVSIPGTATRTITVTPECQNTATSGSEPPTTGVHGHSSCYCQQLTVGPETTVVVCPQHTASAPVQDTSLSANQTTVCRTYNRTDIDFEELDEVVSSLVKHLSVNTRNLSKTIREKSSALDERASVQTIGYSIISLIVVPFVLIVIVDIPGILHTVVKSYLRIKRKGTP